MAPEHHERQRRRKVALACEPCRYRKSRCDGSKPICSTCLRRSIPLEQCIYRTANARTACSDDYTRSLHERIRELEHACSSRQNDVHSAGASPAQRQKQNYTERYSLAQDTSPSVALGSDISQDQSKTPSSTSHDQIDVAENTASVTAMGTVLCEDLLNGSFKGPQDFYGGSSTVSFLKEAYGPIDSHLPSQTLQAQEQQRTGAQSSLSNLHKFPLPPRPLADHLIQRYFERIYYLYPFFDREAFETTYQQLWQAGGEQHMNDPKQYQGLGLGSSPGGDTSSIVFHCALNAIFALASTFSDLAASEKSAAVDIFFNRAKSHVGIDLLDMNNIGVVQALLLIALALQGTPFPNRCWNAVGVACRVAQGLGLHADENRQYGETREKMVRRRTWYGCVIMDMLVSMTFGRPNMTTNLPVLPQATVGDGATGSSPEPEQLKLQFNIESVRLGRVLEGILSKIYQPWLNRSSTSERSSTLRSDLHHSLDNIVELHTQLTGFEQSLPPSLSWKCPTSFNMYSQQDRLIFETQRTVLHARFLYLQLMLHRPILTHLLTTDAGGDVVKDTNLPQTNTLKNGLMSSFALECAKSCIEAAMQVVDLIYNTHLTETSDMWWWNGLYACTAGLVLIFARLCGPLWDSLAEEEVSKSWEQCQTILTNLSSFSSLSRKSIRLLLKVNEIVLAKRAAKKRGSDQPPEAEVVGQEEVPPDDQESPKETSDHSLPLGLGVQDPNEMDIIGSFFSSWDQTLELMPSDFY